MVTNQLPVFRLLLHDACHDRGGGGDGGSGGGVLHQGRHC